MNRVRPVSVKETNFLCKNDPEGLTSASQEVNAHRHSGSLVSKKCINCGKALQYYSDRGIKEYENRKFCTPKCTSVFNSKKWVGKPSRGLGHRLSPSQRKNISDIVTQWHKTINKEKHRQAIKEGVHKKSPNFNGGRSSHSDGYTLILRGIENGHSKYDGEHRLIMQKIIGRKLKDGEVVHHINEVRNDNRPENLMLFSSSIEHLRYHAMLRRTAKFNM